MTLHPIGPTSGFPTTYFTQARIDEIFEMTKYFIKYNMPIIMIILALIIAGMTLYLVIDIFHNAKDDKSRNDDEDFDYY
jgi:hypothetical protein